MSCICVCKSIDLCKSFAVKIYSLADMAIIATVLIGHNTVDDVIIYFNNVDVVF